MNVNSFVKDFIEHIRYSMEIPWAGSVMFASAGFAVALEIFAKIIRVNLIIWLQ